MYVTRRLSHFKRFPDALTTPPEGPHSGYLVIQDEESEIYSCFGLCKNRYLKELPFPQNMDLSIRYDTGGENSATYLDHVVLIPVLNQPLSSNRYYAIQPHGKHKGEAFTCSREEDKQTRCFCRCVKDIKPRPLDPHNVYQQFKIEPYATLCSSTGYYFHGKSLSPDGFPPKVFRRKGWSIGTKTPKNYQLGEATGLNASLREVLPDFKFPISPKMLADSRELVVGKWYIPFVFVKEGMLRDQMERSRFYETTLERKWEQIFACQNNYNEGNSVTVDVALETETVYVSGNKAVRDGNNVVDGVVWFRKAGSKGKAEESRIGLRVEVVERMKWEQERAGWLGGEKNQVRVQRVEEYGDIGGWKEFGCYVLVESFVLRRMDGTVVMSYDFRHTHQIKSKWK